MVGLSSSARGAYGSHRSNQSVTHPKGVPAHEPDGTTIRQHDTQTAQHGIPGHDMAYRGMTHSQHNTHTRERSLKTHGVHGSTSSGAGPYRFIPG